MMTTVTNIGQRILDENDYSTPSVDIVEYLVDNAIDYINMEAGTSIAELSGVAETKSLTGTKSEIAVVKALSVLMLRAYKDRGPQVSVAGLNVAVTLSDPQYSLFTKMVNRGINRLRGRSFETT